MFSQLQSRTDLSLNNNASSRHSLTKMFTEAEITTGADRLESGKLKAKDIDSIITAFRKYFKHLETKYSYAYRTDLEALDDTGNDKQTCAEIGAALDKMTSFSWGSAAKLQGGSDAIFFEENSRYFEYVAIIFTKLYAWPEEMGSNGIIRRGKSYTSNAVGSYRAERCWDENYMSERERRRRM